MASYLGKIYNVSDWIESNSKIAEASLQRIRWKLKIREKKIEFRGRKDLIVFFFLLVHCFCVPSLRQFVYYEASNAEKSTFVLPF